MGKGKRIRDRRLRCIPSHMPAVRDAMVEHMRSVEEKTMESATPFERVIIRSRPVSESIRAASLWYVSRDMTEVARVAAMDGAPRVDPPTQSGLMFFGGELKAGVERLWGLFWVDYGSTIFVSAVADRGDGSLDMTMTHIGWLEDIARTVWALSLEKSVCDVVDETSSAAPSGSRPDKPDPMARTVKMVVLREGARASSGGGGDWSGYDHRFIVRGFWRDQPCGPNHSERRRQWIPPFIKGPKDAPLIIKDTVNVWRR